MLLIRMATRTVFLRVYPLDELSLSRLTSVGPVDVDIGLPLK